MSYVDRAQDPARRGAAIAATVGFHAALGIIVVTGLTIAGIGPTREYRPILEFPTEPPPQPPQPDPQPQPEVRTQPRVAVIPRIELVEIPDPTLVEFDTTEIEREVIRVPDPPTRLEPQLPAARFTPQDARPTSRPASWISNSDYPRRALVDEAEGSGRYRLIIGTTGRVSSCEVTVSTGNRQLDDATCRLITSRARFEPATDENGTKVVGSYSGSVRWDIPE